LFHLKNFKIQSLEARTSATCNHNSNQITSNILSQHVDTTLIFMFTTKIDISQAYFRNYDRKSSSNQNSQKCIL